MKGRKLASTTPSPASVSSVSSAPSASSRLLTTEMVPMVRPMSFALAI